MTVEGSDAIARGVFIETLLALVAPKRLVPFAAVALPLVVSEAIFSHDSRSILVGLCLCLSFWLLGPAGWRWLCPTLDPSPAVPRLFGVVLFVVATAADVVIIGRLVPIAIGLGPSFLTVDVSLAIMVAMFAVGSWGLGRDIDLEIGLAKERERAEALAAEAERAGLLALRAHLDPHFLFNTLNAIAELCQQDPPGAERATLKLASMLRSVLAGVRTETWPLSKEIELLRELFELHRIRDPERFASEVRAPEPLPTAEVPPMILMPLAENAMKHGPGAGHRGVVRLAVEVDGGELVFRLANPGAFTGRRPGGEGLEMVDRRLALAYGEGASLEMATDGEETTATLTVPTDPTSGREGEAS